MKYPTWMIHAVCDHGKFVYYTNGLYKYDSLELELNLSIKNKQAQRFLNIIGYEIANNGKRFKDGDIDNTLFTAPIAFKEVEGIYGDGEKNLRVIFQDTNFKFPWEDGCEEPYKSQI